MAAPSKSWTVSTPVRISTFPCRCFRSPIPHGRKRMPHKLIAVAASTLLLAGCLATTPRSRDTQALPAIDRNATEATLIGNYLDACLKVASGTPAEQAEVLATVSNDYHAAPA